MKKSFALIYTLLFITLLLIGVSATWFTGLADLRLAQRTEYSTEAMQMAKSAIDDGWYRYKKEVGSTNQIQKTFPTGACTPVDSCTTSSKIVRVNPNVSPPTETSSTAPINLSVALTLSEQIEGRYDIRYYWNSTKNPAVETIEGIGYYKGNKITLKADVTHNDTWTCSVVESPCQETNKIWNHTNDYLTIYQTGPSK